MRPSISFRLVGAIDGAARIFIDSLDTGSAAEYLEGRGALRILPGTHLVQVVAGGVTVWEEKVYVADGVNRTLIVK